MDNTQNLVWTSNKPTVRGRYRLRCGKHEKDFTVILVENDPDMLFLIGDDFSTMGYKCDGGELWAKLPDEKFTRTADDIFPDVSEHIETVKKEFRARCQKNVDDINRKCAYEGESFSKYKECFDASKEYLRNGKFIPNDKE